MVVRICWCAVMAGALFVPTMATAAERAAGVNAEAGHIAPSDWPWWRGPTRDGLAAADQQPPLEWSDTENVLWQTDLSGRGHSSPIVVGRRVFVTTADEQRQTQSVLCFDRDTGDAKWTSVVHEGGLSTKGNKKASQASSSVACDGDRVFVNFLNQDAVFTTALDLDGKRLWQTKITDYVVHQGYGSSPAVYGRLVIVSADNKGGGAIAALDRETGAVVWKRDRPETPNYASPVILKVDGRDQLLFTGCDLVSSFEPLTGKPLWEMEGATTECVTSTVTDGRLVYSSGGYPKNHVAAVRGDGSGKVEWEIPVRVYVPSLLVRDGLLFGVTDAGVAMCWKCETGEEVWKHRLGGTFSSSPVLVGDHLFATNESGTTYVGRVNSKNYTPVAKNNLGDEVFATPTICGSRVYMRVAFHADGERRERLYCLASVRK